MPVTFVNGQPEERGQPMVLVAVALALDAGTARIRTKVRELAEWGFGGVYLTDLASPGAVVAKDAARRAGLAVLVDEPWVDEQHVAVAGKPPAATPEEAFGWLFDGHRIVHGDLDAVAGVQAFLRLVDHPLAWRPVPGPAGWKVRGSEDERAAYSSEGGSYRLEVPAGSGQALHFVGVQTGEVVGLVALAAGETHLLRLEEGRPIVLYLGPNRYEPDVSITRPD